MDRNDLTFNAWNPGLESEIPGRLKELITLFRKENSTVSYGEAMGATELCGLKPQELCSLSAKRLIVHELLIRVTADLSVPDGPNYEDLGISLRSMVSRILKKHINPELDNITIRFRDYCNKVEARIFQIFNQEFLLKTTESEGQKKRLEFPTVFRNWKSEKSISTESRDIKLLRKWSIYPETPEDIDSCCKFALARVIGGIIGVKGKLVSDQGLFLPLVLRVFLNSFGGYEIGRLIGPTFKTAVMVEDYRYLPSQLTPIVMNTKGASAAGKSTIRPQQRHLAERMDIPWKDFALISPDYWRKFLLDYSSLGADYKYGAMLTGHELELIDKKLDLYMAQKAKKGEMPHLLIDRFRFDSFTIGGDGNYNSRLLTRFGEKVFLFFVITSPSATVERAWKRGLSTSRYKAVDDLLSHNIEAYTGMPELFFSWMAIQDKEINFEFLDNNVELGVSPKTIAFGKGGKMTVLDLAGLSNIDLFKEVNIKAKKPDEVLDLNYKTDHSFVKQCFSRIPVVTLVDSETGAVYGSYDKGSWVYKDHLHKPKTDLEKECLLTIGWAQATAKSRHLKPTYNLIFERELTLGS
ncbi:MAG: hypothetical protein O3A15_08660 [Proteobacteria bacterium]|jgi:hypothetical protein|nr:hypothetical protein [Pseudomonadota bacterium]